MWLHFTESASRIYDDSLSTQKNGRWLVLQQKISDSSLRAWSFTWIRKWSIAGLQLTIPFFPALTMFRRVYNWLFFFTLPSYFHRSMVASLSILYRLFHGICSDKLYHSYTLRIRLLRIKFNPGSFSPRASAL